MNSSPGDEVILTMSIEHCRTITKKLVLIGINLFFWLILSFGSLNLIKTTVGAAEPLAQIDIQACPQGLAIKRSLPISEGRGYLVLEPIKFTGTVTRVISPAGTIAYIWDFGDGTVPLTRPVAVHSYRVSNSYTITLKAEGNPCAMPPITKTERITVTGLITKRFFPIIFGNL